MTQFALSLSHTPLHSKLCNTFHVPFLTVQEVICNITYTWYSVEADGLVNELGPDLFSLSRSVEGSKVKFQSNYDNFRVIYPKRSNFTEVKILISSHVILVPSPYSLRD